MFEDMVVVELTVSSEVGRGLVVSLVFVCAGGVEGLNDFIIVDTTQLHCACSAGFNAGYLPCTVHLSLVAMK